MRIPQLSGEPGGALLVMALSAANMSARQRRSELAAIIASGIAKAIAARSESAGQPEVSAADGLALSAGSRLSVPLAEPPDRNGHEAGEHA